jgi:hypothetical protein
VEREKKKNRKSKIKTYKSKKNRQESKKEREEASQKETWKAGRNERRGKRVGVVGE